jgi:hypothetical protein
MRERLCLAVMPLIGPYTRERPRRPKGGPDGGRDIEAIHEGSTVTWGAVGFRNGGGNDETARRDASSKFESDLARALEENPTLQAFVFFTNVDLTPTVVERLKETASAKGVPIVDIVDLERLRHALDSPEGLIARLQYLEIPMSATEQITLVNKFGTQLQSAVATRFDRVERTLSQMNRFLDFQKPLYRLDAFVALEGQHSSSDIGNQWRSLTAYCELSLTTGRHRVRIADLTTITMTAFVTEGLYPHLRRIMLDANGYELFNCPAANAAGESHIELPETVKDEIGDV